jgi:hypothetical protein
MSTSFLGSNHFIPLERAKAMTARFRVKKKEILNPNIGNKEVLPISETFDRVAFDKVLAQKGCAGMRIYLGLDDALQLRLILVGVNEKGEDMIAVQTTNSIIRTEEGEPTLGEIIEDGIRCPPSCPPASPLNTQP